MLTPLPPEASDTLVRQFRASYSALTVISGTGQALALSSYGPRVSEAFPALPGPSPFPSDASHLLAPSCSCSHIACEAMSPGPRPEVIVPALGLPCIYWVMSL